MSELVYQRKTEGWGRTKGEWQVMRGTLGEVKKNKEGERELRLT